MEITNARYAVEGGRSVLLMEVDGVLARIGYEQKLARFGYVYLGAQFEDTVLPLPLPADPKNNRPASEVRGFTADPRVLQMYRRFQALADEGEVPAGPVEGGDV